MKILTIVIPSYNSMEFIDKNMKTFIDKRLFERVELLLINDGSTDDTAKRAKAYERKYSGYVRLIDKENGGHGSVINRGIEEASGKYFKVIDADDWVDTDNLLKLVAELERCQDDLILNPYVKVDQRTGKTINCGKVTKLPKNQTIEFERVKERNIYPALHSATYKTKILKENNIKLTEKCFYEDFEYNLFPLPYIRTCRMLDFPVYWYLIGQKTQSVNASNGLKNVNMYIEVMYDSLDYYNSRLKKIDINTGKYMENFICIFIRSLYNIFLRNGQVDNIQQKMFVIDQKIKNKSDYFYQLVAKKNTYIKLLRLNNDFIFKSISFFFLWYKRKNIL